MKRVSMAVLALALVCTPSLSWAQYRGREVFSGIPTNRLIPGEPYDLLGTRIVFTNWYYVQPGDLDWSNGEGKSVYVEGDEDPSAAIFVGKEAPRGIRIRAKKPAIVGPIDMPHRTILQDGDLYRGWSNNEYFESTDGMHWDKKANMVFDKEEDGLYHIFIDPHVPPSERFKAVWTASLSEEAFNAFREKRPDGWEPRSLLHFGENHMAECLRGSVSADGITWKTLPEPFVVEYSDTYNTCYYDQFLGKYVIYTRYWSIGPYTKTQSPDIRNSWTGVGRRAIGRTESAEFGNFPPSEMVLEASPQMLPSEVLYTNCHTTVPHAPDVHLMFPTVWNASVTDATRVVMASSHDGIHWDWVPDGDLMETQTFGQWNGGCVWALPELLEFPDGTWALPYAAHNVPHKYPRGQRVGALGYATWPKGRMVALEAPDTGQFTLITVIAPGKSLKINAVTARTGGIWVEVAGVDNHAFGDCTRLFGDCFWKPVDWKGDATMGIEAGKPVTLRFKMDQAEIYGLEFY